MQLARERAHAEAERLRLLQHAAQPPARLGLRRGNLLAQAIHVNRQQRNPLADVVVQHVRDPPALVFLRLQRGAPLSSVPSAIMRTHRNPQTCPCARRR